METRHSEKNAADFKSPVTGHLRERSHRGLAHTDRLRARWLTLALRVELASLAWVMLEAAGSGVAAVHVGSLAISAFSVDSAVEFIAGLTLFFRLYWESQTGSTVLAVKLERFAAAVVGICLFVLAGWIAFQAGQAFAVRQPVAASPLGLMIAALSSVVTPWFARQKRHLGVQLHSHALLGDAACSTICAYMAWTLLIGLLLQTLFGWVWVDPVAALGILYFVLREAWESLLSAWKGVPHVHEH